VLVTQFTSDLLNLLSIIAVHGLGGHYLDSWTEKLSDGSTICWLEEFIPKQFGKQVRVMSFGYESETAFSQSVNTIVDTARVLLNAILDNRMKESEKQRPIIFICHSLGGIIVKKVEVSSDVP
jgi:protein SERAC1